MYKTFEMELDGKPLVIETGKMALLANSAVLVRYGDTVVSVAVAVSENPRDGVDFFPLSIDYEEKLYSVGKIPGGFIKREGKPSEKSILVSRVIDRPLRPLFPKGFRNDVSITATVLSVDKDNAPEFAAMIGASAALSISDLPLGTGVPWACRIAPHRALQAGDMINTELEAKYGGYIAQTVQAASLGKIPTDLKDAFDISVRVFEELVEFMKPGVSFRAIVRFYQKLVRDSGHRTKGMLLHGRGIGEDRPQITGEIDGDTYNSATYTKHLDLPLVEGNVFVLKPGAMPDDAPDSIRCGDTIVIEKSGARRLGKRSFSFPELC